MLFLFWVYFSLVPFLLPLLVEFVEYIIEMVKSRLRKLVDTEEAMNKFVVDYKIPPNISLRHCKMGE